MFKVYRELHVGMNARIDVEAKSSMNKVGKVCVCVCV